MILYYYDLPWLVSLFFWSHKPPDLVLDISWPLCVSYELRILIKFAMVSIYFWPLNMYVPYILVTSL